MCPYWRGVLTNASYRYITSATVLCVLSLCRGYALEGEGGILREGNHKNASTCEQSHTLVMNKCVFCETFVTVEIAMSPWL